MELVQLLFFPDTREFLKVWVVSYKSREDSGKHVCRFNWLCYKHVWALVLSFNALKAQSSGYNANGSYSAETGPGRRLTRVPLVCAEPGAIQEQQLQPEDVINHEEEQHEHQRDAQTATQLHGGQRHWRDKNSRGLATWRTWSWFQSRASSSPSSSSWARRVRKPRSFLTEQLNSRFRSSDWKSSIIRALSSIRSPKSYFTTLQPDTHTHAVSVPLLAKSPNLEELLVPIRSNCGLERLYTCSLGRSDDRWAEPPSSHRPSTRSPGNCCAGQEGASLCRSDARWSLEGNGDQNQNQSRWCSNPTRSRSNNRSVPGV